GTSGTITYNQGIMPDPLIDLPTPGGASTGATDTTNNTATTVSSGSWSTQSLGSPAVTNQNAKGLTSPNYVDTNGTVQLYPGVYSSISISGGNVNFNPGVYVLSPQKNTPTTLNITGSNGSTVTGNGVMFYNTGGDYVASTGYPDYGDASTYDPNS